MVSIVVGLVLVATLLFAGVAGSKVERLGALIVLANVLAGILLRAAGAPLHVSWGFDLLTAMAFGALALRNPEKLWPGVAGVAMTFVMVFSATRAVGFPLSDFAHSVTMNLSGLLVQAALFAGTWSHCWGRKADEDLLAPA